MLPDSRGTFDKVPLRDGGPGLEEENHRGEKDRQLDGHDQPVEGGEGGGESHDLGV